MLRAILCILIWLDGFSALYLEKNRPGALPILSTQVSNGKSGVVGGYSTYDLSHPDKYEDLEHLIQLSLDYVQGRDQGNFSNPDVSKYKVHKLITIKEAIYQVVSGFNYKAIFTVGERDCTLNQGKSNTTNATHRYQGCRISQNGQYGKCYFKIYSQSWTGHLEVNEHTCVEATKQEAS